MFELKNVNFHYNKKNPILKNINFKVEAGKIYILMGENGSGKSTLLMLLKGINKPTGGEIFFKGRKNKKQLLEIGFVFQDPDVQIVGPDVESDIHFGPLNLKWEAEKVRQFSDEAMIKCNIYHLKNKNPYHLSYGEKRRIAIAGILAMNPEVLVLDEPTTWLDPYHQENLKELLLKLKQEGKTLIISTHDIQFAKDLDGEYVLLKDGSIEASGDKTIFNDLQLLEKCRLSYRREQN